MHCQRAIEDMNERCIQRHPQRCKRTSCAISQGCRADIWLWRLTAPWPCSAGVGWRHHHSLSGLSRLAPGRARRCAARPAVRWQGRFICAHVKRKLYGEGTEVCGGTGWTVLAPMLTYARRGRSTMAALNQQYARSRMLRQFCVRSVCRLICRELSSAHFVRPVVCARLYLDDRARVRPVRCSASR